MSHAARHPRAALAAVAVLAMGCDAEPRTSRALHRAVLDSLARAHPCDRLPFRVLHHADHWSARHACGVAGHSVARLAVARVAEPHFAPRDTARIRAITVIRSQPCMLAHDSSGAVVGRWGALRYVVEMDVPARPRFITAVVDPATLATEISVVHKGLDGSDTLVVVPDMSRGAEAGTPCDG